MRFCAFLLTLCLLIPGLCACGTAGDPVSTDTTASPETVSAPESTAAPETTASTTAVTTAETTAKVPETTEKVRKDPVIDLLDDKNRYYCESDEQGLTIMWRYNGKNLALKMCIKGVNKIFDVKGLYYNTDAAFTNDLTKYTLFINNSTDWIGPVLVRAVQNIDGDMKDVTHFTGGNHGYDNTGTVEGNTATGATRELQIEIDGAVKTSFKGYCNTVKVDWKDYIQATNTKKADGTGREVMREDHVVVFDGSRSGFDITTEFVALELISFMRVYGLQCSSNSKFESITFVGSKTNDQPQKLTSDRLYGDLNTTSIRLKGPVNVEYGVTEGLADGTYRLDHAAFTSATKTYLQLIDYKAPKKCTLAKDKSVYYVGFYSFD